ncbi:MAG: XisH family protein [Caldilineaceae bacterium]|nr:XisH family protein [Caldilineaceae bacterium]
MLELTCGKIKIMAQKDIYHETVIKALAKEDWKITDDPFRVRVGRKRLKMDLGAERLISAEKGTRKIVVEIKSFIGRSDVKDLQQALGQYLMYQQVLMVKNIARELYLAVPHRTYKSTFQDELGQILLQTDVLRLIVFDEDEEVIVAWIPS